MTVGQRRPDNQNVQAVWRPWAQHTSDNLCQKCPPHIQGAFSLCGAVARAPQKAGAIRGCGTSPRLSVRPVLRSTLSGPQPPREDIPCNGFVRLRLRACDACPADAPTRRNARRTAMRAPRVVDEMLGSGETTSLHRKKIATPHRTGSRGKVPAELRGRLSTPIARRPTRGSALKVGSQ